ncbi:glycosyltransferase [Pollutimonas bauzanensis]|uniref:Glycosyltransferase involved in cell wall bisynthesis n=1 Tax=Pollutimonas bauzanensis TaxID=658167 RepID=A0A1M6BK69_9BURK|nr:glycosyltransferase [Pollutimonas bauzanensis]SHI49101.1 Glycosyltransferase involved in cell wall bisynthesis [Pollutimonas bauzanensis]
MRIVIDLQGAQSSGSRNRGIGRYSLSLVQAIARNCGEHDIVLALNGAFPDAVESIQQAFQGLLPAKNIHVWYAPDSTSYANVNNSWRRQSSELLRESFLASLDPSVILVTSLFEGLGDDAVSSIGRLNDGVHTAVILYDLIPFINRDLYLSDARAASWYDEKVNYLLKSGLMLAISESSRQEAVEHLGASACDVVNISTACDPQFGVKFYDREQRTSLYTSYGISRPYVMYTGGIDHRKNIEGLIRAYSRLPLPLRQSHQLALICAINPDQRIRLEKYAEKCGLSHEELVLTGYVPEEDLVALYNLCKVFVFPSWHEGFGLPALEAMACGKAVIAAKTSSLPEVLGCEAALFDPFDDASVAGKLEQVLVDDEFRNQLEHHGLRQAKQFSWDKSAKAAISALEAFVERSSNIETASDKLLKRPRLAYVSPLPPLRSGISDYSAELLPELARYYEIDVIVMQDSVTVPWILSNCSIRTVDWFRFHADEYDRVLYHFGNSEFHQHMFSLLESIPGVVVLHDFFLSGIVSYMDFHGSEPGGWASALYEGHGYLALKERFTAANIEDVKWKYPCNARVLQNSRGIIVHSENSRRLARRWYPAQDERQWECIPLLRLPTTINESIKIRAREALGFQHEDFIVCSFGLLGPSKLNQRLLDGWLASPLATDEKCVLIFVGENEGGEYGRQLSESIAESNTENRIRITGWTDTEVFHQYLAAADVAVQLRTLSRGETSAAVLDCMNYGLATVANANGSMADLPDDGIWKLPDHFSDKQLINALTLLRQNVDQRLKLGRRAQDIVHTQHAPEICSYRYYAAIERFYNESSYSIPTLIEAIAQLELAVSDSSDLMAIAAAIDRSIEPKLKQRQLLVDISEFIQCENKSEISSDLLALLHEWLLLPPKGFRVEPVYFDTQRQSYRYARKLTLELLECSSDMLIDEPISYYMNDVFLGGRSVQELIPAQQEFQQIMRRHGAHVWLLDYEQWARFGQTDWEEVNMLLTEDD